MGTDFELISSICFFVSSVLGTSFYAWKVKKAHFTEPIYQFLFFYSLFVLPLPIRVCITKQVEGDITEHLPLLIPYMPSAVTLCALGLPFFIWGYYGRLPRWFAGIVPRPAIGKHSRAAFLLITVVALFLVILLARTAGGLLDFILLGYGGTSEMVGRGYLAIGFPWLWVATLFLLYRYSIYRAKTDLIIFGIAFGANTLVAFMMGQRSSLVYFGLAGLLFWHHAIRPFSMKRVAILGVVAFVGLNLVGVVRGSGYESLPDFWDKLTKTSGIVSELPEIYTYTLTNGEFVVPFESLPQMIESVGSSVNPQLGATYLKAPLLWIPSALYPSRPLPLANWYMQEFYGSGLGLNEGRQFFFLAEGYLNFGVFGVFATIFGWGAFLGTCRRYLRTNSSNPGAVLLYAITVAFIMRGVSGDFASMIVGLPEQNLSAVIIGLWITRWRLPHLFQTKVRLSVT